MRSLDELLNVSAEGRDPDWENQFFHQITKSNVNILSPDPQVGPDNWPYLLVETDKEAHESVQKILHWLHDKGIGLVVNPTEEYPDYVFTYGMIWHFKETGLFYKTMDQIKPEVVEIKENESIYYGQPSESFLPGYVRKILLEFFRDQGLIGVKINLLSDDNKNFDLCFSLESLGNPDTKEHHGIAEAISWFLPPHYSIVLISEKGLPPFSLL
ncbi:MAG: hypothetical protein JNL11_08930 [Bdellovibrionaceae bacterium]|nr:hypothetical protein [Pseudobdellovibrionaceae bacterium]